MPANELAAGATDAFQRRILALRDATTKAVTSRWVRLDPQGRVPDQLDGWASEVAPTVSVAQVQAARLASVYVDLYLRHSGVTATGFDLDPERFAGADRHGRPLAEALDAARIAALWRLGRGGPPSAALAYGLDTAIRVTRTSVTGAARSAMTERMDAEPAITGYRRVTSAKPCGACLALAGRYQRTSDAFDAHDRCSCFGEPVIRGVRETVRRPTGQERFDAMTDAERVDLFRGTGAADKASVVAERGVDVLVGRLHGQLVERPLAELL